MLRGLRFQKRLRLLPGVRINLSKSGVSTSVGPRGADVNIGRDGITTNAGIPGTGLSYRQKLGGKSSSTLIGVLALVAGLGFAAYKNADKIGSFFAPAPVSRTAAATQKVIPVQASGQPAPQSEPVRPSAAKPAGIRAQAAKLLVAGGTIYVRRAGSALRENEKTSGKPLQKLDKGAAVTIVALDGDWTRVKAGDVTGWMRTSVLGPKP